MANFLILFSSPVQHADAGGYAEAVEDYSRAQTSSSSPRSYSDPPSAATPVSSTHSLSGNYTSQLSGMAPGMPGSPGLFNTASSSM